MKLHSLRIQGLRKHLDTEIHFGESTFLIGQNNIGKSTVFKALEYLLTDVKKLDDIDEFFSMLDSESNQNRLLTDEIILTAEFRNCPEEANTWRGLKGRVFTYDNSSCPDETGYRIFYRKTFEKGSNVKIEMKQLKRNLKPGFTQCRTLDEYIQNGLSEELISEEFPGAERGRNLNAGQKNQIQLLDDLYDIDENEDEWFLNPGGIPGNVLSRLPNFLLIPAQDKIDELSGTSGALVKTLNSLFEEVRNASHNFQEAQRYLGLLQQELDPDDGTKEFGRMMNELNTILDGVFPNTKLLAAASLSDANRSIKPVFEVKMSSNVNTRVENQGTGVIRSAVFAMLRYRNMRENLQATSPLIIGFEEPEIYLHPNAAHQLRDTIYDLANTENNQIVCTTHSPFMIDLSRKSEQVLNHFSILNETYNYGGQQYDVQKIQANPFNLTESFHNLTREDKPYVKMIVRMDDQMAKIFFVNNVLIVEGDTEDIVLRETIQRMPNEVRKDILHNWHIVKARGKASIISLVKYLNAMGLRPFVIHDKDTGTAGAEVFNQPILELVGEDRIFPLENCIEDILGYPAPTSEKPFRAYRYINSNWGETWPECSSGEWKTLVERIFTTSFELIEGGRRAPRRGIATRGIAQLNQQQVETEPIHNN
ncbi:AAA family ATPase [Bacillus sp. 1P10SD]|uniref:AAA family ATPase n=1 Tax=Bacillus sp. 1P10SD TaxID=3132265 RepID=UPI0039A67CE0